MYPPNIIPFADSQLLVRAGFMALYFVGFEGDGETAPIKVGIATNVHSRLGALQTGNWRALIVHELLFVHCGEAWVRSLEIEEHTRGRYAERQKALKELEGRPMVSVNQIEFVIHRELKAAGLHCRGEWFNGGVERLVQLAKDVIQGGSVEYHTCKSMLRKLKMWKVEAELA